MVEWVCCLVGLAVLFIRNVIIVSMKTNKCVPFVHLKLVFRMSHSIVIGLHLDKIQRSAASTLLIKKSCPRMAIK